MNGNLPLTVTDLLNLIASIVNLSLLIIAIVGIFLTLHQIRQNYHIQKTTFFKEIYLAFLSEKTIWDAFYYIEKNQFLFEKNFLGTSAERDIDALLCFFDMISKLYLGKMLTAQELHHFDYEFTTIYTNKEIRKYLDYIRDLYDERRIKNLPFVSFISYCKNDLHI